MPPPPLPLGVYRHYKGNLYRVLGVAKHSETGESLVVYETLYENPYGKLWVRPLAMFMETIQIENGPLVPRFQYLGEQPSSS